MSPNIWNFNRSNTSNDDFATNIQIKSVVFLQNILNGANFRVFSLIYSRCYHVFRSILRNTLHPLEWYEKSLMIGAWTYLLLFTYWFGILIFMFARIMFGSSLLRSFIAYHDLSCTTKGEHHVVA